jgi:hypothetical protein
VKTFRRPTGATVIAVVALFISVGGGAYAAAAGLVSHNQLAPNSVWHNNIGKGSVKPNNLSNGSVGHSKLQSNSVWHNNIGQGSVQGNNLSTDIQNELAKHGATGATGATGPQGPPGPQGPAGPPAQTVVTSLSSPWSTTNPSVSLTPDGVPFGPYADGGAQGGSLVYAGLNGQPFSAVKNLVYYMRYVTSSSSSPTVEGPYLRVWTNGNVDDAVFSPSTQAPDPDNAQGPFHEWVATSGTWRYDDDAGSGPDSPLSEILAAHGSEPISRITITTGFSSGTNLAALLRWVESTARRSRSAHKATHLNAH